MRIVFMGTPDYSVATLSALYDAGYEIKGVFAQPDKPVGRKQILTPPPAKVFAVEHGIPVFQPKTLRDGEAMEIIRELDPEMIVVVAYGKILPAEILDYPKFGCVNGHASLLPKLRGSSPIQWAIVSGLKKTGVTTMLMDEGMDTGDILETFETDIGEDETAEELFSRLSNATARLMLSTVSKLKDGKITPTKQNESDATYAPIIKKEMAHLDFSFDALTLSNAVRGYYSWPCAYTFIGGKRIKIISAKSSGKTEKPAGEVIESRERLVIACGNGTSLELVTVQPEGKKAMSAADMLKGNPIPVGTVAE